MDREIPEYDDADVMLLTTHKLVVEQVANAYRIIDVRASIREGRVLLVFNMGFDDDRIQDYLLEIRADMISAFAFVADYATRGCLFKLTRGSMDLLEFKLRGPAIYLTEVITSIGDAP